MKRLDTTKEIGAYGERVAARYLRLHGYAIKARNFRVGRLELDIVAENFRDLAFVEVKTRTYSSITPFSKPPHTAVNAEKRELTRRAARHYLSASKSKKQPRMDVLEVYLLQKEGTNRYKVAKIEHHKAAY